MTIRQLLCVLILIGATAAAALGQGTGGSGTGGGGTGGGGTGGGGQATGGTNTNADQGSGGATVAESTDDSALAQTITEMQQKSLSTEKVNNLRTNGVGRVGVVNNLGAGLISDQTSGAANSNTGGGTVGAGVRFRDASGKGRYTSTTTTARGGAGGTGRTGGGALGGANSGLNNAFGNTGTMGSLNSAAAVRIPVAYYAGAKQHLAQRATPESSRLVSTRIRSLPALSQLQQAEVVVDGRIATLRGSVSSQAAKDRIGRMAKMAQGVDSVVNEIVVNEQGSPSDRQTPRQ